MIQTLFLTRASATLSRSRASGGVDAGELRLQHRRRARAARRCPASVFWSALRMACASSSPMCEAEPPDQLAGVLVLLVDGEAHAEAELGVVFEQRVGPGRSAALVVGAVGRGRQVAAVDRGAAGGVGDQHAVAEELGHQLDVRRFAAAGAGAGELEERLEQLDVLHLAEARALCGRSRGSSGRSPSWRLRLRAAAAGAPC